MANLSYPSIAAFMFDVPEPSGVSGQFIYEHYVEDERVSTSTALSATVPVSYARKIEIEIQPPDSTNLSSTTEVLEISSVDKKYLMSNYLTEANDEHQIQGNNFSTLVFEDTDVSSDLTAAIIESVATTTGYTAVGINEALELLSATSDIINVDSLLSNARLDTVNEYSFYDPNEGTSKVYASVEGANSFSIAAAINQKFVSDILKVSESAPLSPLFGKIDSDISTAETDQISARSSQDSSSITIDQYEPIMTTVGEESTVESGATTPTGIAFLGYIIQKYELIDGEESFIANAYIVDEDEGGFSPISASKIDDHQVKYGSTYAYYIRSVYLLRYLEFESLEAGSSATARYSVVKSRSSPKLNVNCVEYLPPDPPTGMQFSRNVDGTIEMYWEPASNPSNDVKKWQIFRRTSIDEPFTLIMQYDFDNTEEQIDTVEVIPDYTNQTLEYSQTSYIDDEFDNDSEYIYAICAVDAHLLSSNYSPQYRVRYDKTIGRLAIDLVSPPGAPKPYPNFFVPNILTTDSITDSLHSYLKIYFTPDYYFITDSDEVDTAFIPWTKLAPRTDPTGEDTYGGAKIQIINLDRQNSQTINIKFEKDSGVDALEP